MGFSGGNNIGNPASGNLTGVEGYTIGTIKYEGYGDIGTAGLWIVGQNSVVSGQSSNFQTDPVSLEDVADGSEIAIFSLRFWMKYTTIDLVSNIFRVYVQISADVTTPKLAGRSGGFDYADYPTGQWNEIKQASAGRSIARNLSYSEVNSDFQTPSIEVDLGAGSGSGSGISYRFEIGYAYKSA